MELSQLRAILALREFASLARVGEQLHLSPSAVFCQIRQLEDETGQKLYERIGKRLRLTAAGELLVEYARSILETHDAALTALREQSGNKRSLLRLGCGPHSSLRVIPHLLRAFLARYPNTEVRLATSDDRGLIRDVRLGLLDAIIMSQPVGEAELEEEPLWSYEMVFVLPPAAKGQAARPRLAELNTMPFILYRRTVVVDSAIRQLCQEAKVSVPVSMENDEPDSIKELVKLGLGFTVLPLWSVADEVKRGSLRILRARRRQYHNFGLLFRNSSYRPRVLAELREVAREWKQWWPLAKHVEPPLPTRAVG